MNKDYLTVVILQMKLNLGFDDEHEFLIADEVYHLQMKKIIERLDAGDVDILVLPELSYCEKYNEYFLEMSKNCLIVFGSHYVGNENYTVVYFDGKKYEIKKMFNSGVEPAIRFQEEVSVQEFLNKHLTSHTFKFFGKKIVVLNCAEYYRVAYYIARNERLNKNLFAFLVPCANNNNQVFMCESMALHNHNDEVYSFVVNSIAEYNGEKYSSGGSYVFGKMSSFERKCKRIGNVLHPSCICSLDDGICMVEGKFSAKSGSNFYRSDKFYHTPKNLKILKIGGNL